MVETFGSASSVVAIDSKFSLMPNVKALWLLRSERTINTELTPLEPKRKLKLSNVTCEDSKFDFSDLEQLSSFTVLDSKGKPPKRVRSLVVRGDSRVQSEIVTDNLFLGSKLSKADLKNISVRHNVNTTVGDADFRKLLIEMFPANVAITFHKESDGYGHSDGYRDDYRFTNSETRENDGFLECDDLSF